MRIRIHRGAAEIGGNCIELEAGDGSRIVLDLGRPLSAPPDADLALPEVSGFAKTDPTLLALVISHPHLDHYGLASGLPVSVPTYIGEEANRILQAAAFFSPISAALTPAGYLHHGEALDLGPFRITPHLNDHSAFDAYSMLVEADGRRLFYTGDLRAHGRKNRMFDHLCDNPPHDLDVMLMEGTHVRADSGHDTEPAETESELEDRFVQLIGNTPGALMVCGSAQNLDRLVTVFRAARRSGRTLVTDLYGASVATAARSSIPQPGFDGLSVYVPHRQRLLVKRSGEFERVERVRACRVFAEQLAADPSQYVFHMPSSTVQELMSAGVLDKRSIVAWSLWDGYLSQPSGGRLKELLASRGIPLVQLHTSGHASVADLQRLAGALNAQRLVPIHSEHTERFEELFPRVERHPDGEWWEV